MLTTVPDLQYLEQFVNERFGTSAAPEIDRALLPESGQSRRLLWKRVRGEEVKRISTNDKSVERIISSIADGDYIYIPVHPLDENRWAADETVESGSISVSASYRTVFFHPDAGGFLDKCVSDEQVMMLKLHLEHSLPGIAGDRRLPAPIIEKCIMLSETLPAVLADDPMANHCKVIPEFLGLSHREIGVLFRRLPNRGLIPMFSFLSADPSDPAGRSLLFNLLQEHYGSQSMSAARDLGEQLARPLVCFLFAGFRAGFSLEMHAQNVLVKPGSDSLINAVFFRDLEGVVFSDQYRIRNALDPLFAGCQNMALVSKEKSMRRWYNRNLDHDLGRIFSWALSALSRSGYFGKKEVAAGVRSIQMSIRKCVKEARLEKLNWPGQIMPFSRSPYGNGFSKGHYYRTRYR